MIKRVTSMSLRDYESFRRDDERFRRSLDAQDARLRRLEGERAVRAIDIAAREQCAARQAQLWRLRMDLVALGRAAGMADAFMWADRLIRAAPVPAGVVHSQ
jgi:hypothetical protein